MSADGSERRSLERIELGGSSRRAMVQGDFPVPAQRTGGLGISC